MNRQDKYNQNILSGYSGGYLTYANQQTDDVFIISAPYTMLKQKNCMKLKMVNLEKVQSVCPPVRKEL